MADEAQRQRKAPPLGSVHFFWALAGILASCSGIMSAGWLARNNPIASLIIGPMHIHTSIISYVVMVSTSHLLVYAYTLGRNSPPYLIGRSVKLRMDLIALWFALTIRLLHRDGNNLLFLCALVSYTIYIHALIQLRFTNLRDMGFPDLVLHMSMESLVCISFGGHRVFLAVLLLCGTSILCRYHFYSASKEHLEEDKEDERSYLLVDSDLGTYGSIVVTCKSGEGTN
ncbi:hypothetical protein COLO4_17546 [Corchorus olitorius]|uniref:Uncharacterized protein n=1 Tax=Corchorus olitorius TaxID=93759 RepID=A0A1R3JCB8_9ROSI|nr:hypothetical protein COLO4_17546 [Corchorus olitorius]